MIEKFDYYFPYKDSTRKIHVYLPENYYENEDEQYPVMYMYDGHNLFDDADATYGTSWGLKDFLDQYDKPMIMVGIECSHNGHERLDEYCPYVLEHGFRGPINGYGKELMDWVVSDLKPTIDEKYRTYSFREATGIGGSSMGGLMAFYSLVAYNEYFSKAACLSPSISICMNQLYSEWGSKDINPDTRAYFSFGRGEIKNRHSALSNAGLFNDLLVDIGGVSYIRIEAGWHNEKTWRKQNKRYMDVLWK